MRLLSVLLTLFLALIGVSTAASQTDVIPRLWLPQVLKSHPAIIPTVRITYIEYDPPGSDVVGEYVDIENQGASDVDMYRWKLSDAAGTTYTFPAFTLGVGTSVRVWTGTGTDTATDLHWGNSRAIWNNAGDKATLKDASGNIVDTYCYLAGCP